jgi:hypothetical protein
MPVILALGRLKEKDGKFEASLSYTVRAFLEGKKEKKGVGKGREGRGEEGREGREGEGGEGGEERRRGEEEERRKKGNCSARHGKG